jgi:membrane protein YdbS with pleckstrin-like domain
VSTLREPSERVSPRARLMWTVEALANTAFTLGLYVALGLAWDPVPFSRWAVLGLAVVMLAYTALMPRWRYAVHRWEVTGTAVYTQTGWWAVEQRIAPMSRIQTVDYEEGALSRLFGLASVTVTTASAAGALEIAALDKALARELVERLTERADAVPGDAT